MSRSKIAHHLTMAGLCLTFAAAGAVTYAWMIEETPVIDFEAGRLVAMGELESTLYNPAYGSKEDGYAAEMEFAAADGSTCRRFVRDELSGVACQHEGDWRLVSLEQVWPEGAMPGVSRMVEAAPDDQPAAGTSAIGAAPAVTNDDPEPHS